MLRRFKQLFIAGFVLCGLCVSAVSACACTHHGSAKADDEPLSCHTVSHEPATTDVTTKDSDSSKIDESCTCFVRTQIPAITVKSETKRSKAERSVAIDNNSTADIVIDAAELLAGDTRGASTLVFHSNDHSRSGHSRAPPRL